MFQIFQDSSDSNILSQQLTPSVHLDAQTMGLSVWHKKYDRDHN